MRIANLTAESRRLIRMLLVVGIAATLSYSLMAALVGRPPILKDSLAYNTSAMRLLNTGTYRYDVADVLDVSSSVEPSAFTVPGYTIHLAAFYLLGPHAAATPADVVADLVAMQPWLIAKNILLGVVSALLIAWSGYRLGGMRTGWIAGLMAAAYVPFGYNATVLLSEQLALVLMAVNVACVVALLARREPLGPRAEIAWMVVFGLNAGLTVLTRAVFSLWLLVPLAVWLLTNRHRLRRALTVALVGVAVIAAVWSPWIVRNAVVYHRFIPLTSSASTPLLDSTGGAPFTASEEAIRTSAERTSNDPDRAVALYRLKTRWHADPLEFISWKAQILWTGVSHPTNLPTDVLYEVQTNPPAEGSYAHEGPFLPITSDAFYNGLFDAAHYYHLALLALALVGVGLGWRRRAVWVLISIPLYYALAHTAILFVVRYFYPAIVPVIVLAAYGVAGLYVKVRSRYV